MTSRIRSWAGSIAVFTLAIGMSWGVRAESLPARLSDAQFWSLSAHLSELGGTFRSDNLLSNELGMQAVIPELLRVSKTGRVYMGVGPEQNFTYIAALRPKMAFIVDVRRGNLDLQLMYKALFDLSADRADVRGASVLEEAAGRARRVEQRGEIFARLYGHAASETLYRWNLQRSLDDLTLAHKLALLPEDVSGIGDVYHAFFNSARR